MLGGRPALIDPRHLARQHEGPGSLDALGVTVRSGERVVLVPAAKTPQEALDLVRRYDGEAAVHVGVTQYSAGVGIRDPMEISGDLFDTFKNMKLGAALFGKVWRIVWKWYGNPKVAIRIDLQAIGGRAPFVPC